MKIYMEKPLATFEFWSGAVDTANRIDELDKWDELEEILEDEYPNGIDETELNDLFWMEPEIIFEWLGINNEDEDNYESQEFKGELVEIDSGNY